MSETVKNDVAAEIADGENTVVSIFDVCGTDDDAVENGKWFNGEDLFGPRGSDIKIKIRRMSSKVSQKARTSIFTKYAKHADKKGNYPEAIDLKMLCEHLSTAIIVDWKGIFGKDKKEITFSPEAAFHLCTKMADFRVAVVATAMNMDNFRADELEQVEGNS